VQETAPAQRKEQAVGEHCRGADVEECRRYFGEEMLGRVCSTCPDQVKSVAAKQA